MLLFFFPSVTLETDDGDLLLDYSKNLITEDILKLLLDMVQSISCYFNSHLVNEGSYIYQMSFMNKVICSCYMFTWVRIMLHEIRSGLSLLYIILLQSREGILLCVKGGGFVYINYQTSSVIKPI